MRTEQARASRSAAATSSCALLSCIDGHALKIHFLLHRPRHGSSLSVIADTRCDHVALEPSASRRCGSCRRACHGRMETIPFVPIDEYEKIQVAVGRISAVGARAEENKLAHTGHAARNGRGQLFYQPIGNAHRVSGRPYCRVFHHASSRAPNAHRQCNTRAARWPERPPRRKKTISQSGAYLQAQAHAAFRGESLAAHELEVGVGKLHHQLAAILSVLLAHIALQGLEITANRGHLRILSRRGGAIHVERLGFNPSRMLVAVC